MAALYKRLVDSRIITAKWTLAREEVLDVGAYRKLDVQFRLVKEGTAGTVWLESAPVNEADAWQQLGASASLLGTGFVNGKKQLSSEDFYRFLRVVSDGAVGGSPVLTVDVVAKE